MCLVHVKLVLRTHDARYMQYQNVYRDLALSYTNVNVQLFCVCGHLVCHILGEYRLRFLENLVMRKVFGLKSEEVTEEWRRLNMEVLSFQYTSPNNIWVIKSKRMKWTGHVTCMVERRAAYRFSVGKLDRERLHEKLRRRWKYNTKKDFPEVVSRIMEWIDLAKDRDSWRALVNALMNLRSP